MQMEQIRLGLEKKLDVAVYANHLLSHFQMREIRLGLEAGLDVFFLQSQANLFHLHPIILYVRIRRDIQLFAQANPDFMDLRRAHIVRR